MSNYDNGEFSGGGLEGPPTGLSTAVLPIDTKVQIRMWDGSKLTISLPINNTLSDLWDRIEELSNFTRTEFELFQAFNFRVYGDESLFSTIDSLGLSRVCLLIRKRNEEVTRQEQAPQTSKSSFANNCTGFKSPDTLRNLAMSAILRLIIASKPPKFIGDLTTALAQEIIALLERRGSLETHHLNYFVKCKLHTINMCSYMHITGKDIQSLTRHTNLNSITLRDLNHISDASIDCLTNLECLARLDLGDNKQITDHAMSSISKIKLLTYLRLDNTGITDKGVVTLCNSSPLLSYLNLSCTVITDLAVKYFHLMPKLKVLLLVECRVSSIEGIEKVTNLERLYLNGTNVTLEGLSRLKELVKLKMLGLESLVNIDADEALESLQSLGLQELIIPNKQQLTDTGISHLTNMPLLTLDLSKCVRITNHGMQYVGMMSKLKTLCLNQTTITDEGLEHLTGLRDLSELTMRRCRVTDQVATLLTALPSLKYLDLSFTNITDMLLRDNHLTNCRMLKTLGFNGTSVTSAGIRSLQLPRLLQLHVNNTSVDANAVPDIPGCPLVKVICHPKKL